MDYRVRKIIALMGECLRQGRPVSSLAKDVNLSTSRLHQVFKEETGMPPAKYLRLLRMQQARELLESSCLSVKEVMVRVGVTDESHFVRDFKKTYGLTPAKYRERFRNGQTSSAAPAGHTRLASIPARLRSRLSLSRPSPPSTADSSTVAEGARQLLRPPAGEASELLRTKKRDELMRLLSRRHTLFAELTAAIAGQLTAKMFAARSILYWPRQSTVSRRPPPAAERPRRPPFASRRPSAPRGRPPVRATLGRG